MNNKIIVIVSSVLVSFFSSLPYFAIPRDAGLASSSYIFSIWFISFILGIVIFLGEYIFIFKKKKSKLLELIIFFCLIAIIPIFVGFALFFLINSSMYYYYYSDSYISNFKDKIGFSVIPMSKNAEFAYCTLTKYSASYKLILDKEMELTFTIDELDHYNITLFDGSTKQYFDNRFEKANDKYISRFVHKSIGTYKIPKGENIITVPSSNPFNLNIFYSKPLLTPSGVLNEEFDYPILFQENYSKDEYRKNVEETKQSTCNGTLINSNHNFINKYVFIPDAKVNLYDGNDTNLIYYFKTSNSGYEEIPIQILTDLQHKPDMRFTGSSEGVKYRDIINRYTGQKLSIFLIKNKSNEFYNSRYSTRYPIDHQKFDEELKFKTELSSDDELYLHRMNAFFYVNDLLNFDNLSIYFEEEISPYYIDYLIPIIENIEPSRIETINFE